MTPDRQPLTFEAVQEGMDIPHLAKRPTTLQLFRFSGVTWNSHRIHYDSGYAKQEGYPDVLVQAHLHGAFLIQMLMEWIGPQGRLIRFGWQNRAAAIPGDELTCSGKVTRKYVEGSRGLIECALEERNQRGEICAPGSALVALPFASKRG